MLPPDEPAEFDEGSTSYMRRLLIDCERRTRYVRSRWPELSRLEPAVNLGDPYGIRDEVLRGDPQDTAARMTRVRLLVVEFRGLDPTAAEKFTPSGRTNFAWHIRDRGLIPWMGSALFGALEFWAEDCWADAESALEAELARIREDAEHRNAAGLLALFLAGRRPLTADAPYNARVCRECRPPPSTLMAAGGRDGAFVPLN